MTKDQMDPWGNSNQTNKTINSTYIIKCGHIRIIFAIFLSILEDLTQKDSNVVITDDLENF